MTTETGSRQPFGEVSRESPAPQGVVRVPLFTERPLLPLSGFVHVPGPHLFISNDWEPDGVGVSTRSWRTEPGMHAQAREWGGILCSLGAS